MKTRLILIIGLLLYALPGLASDGKTTYSRGDNLLFVFLTFAAVIVAAAYGTKWVAGRFGGVQGRILRIAESAFLGPNRGLHLVLVGKKLFLIGQSEREMNLLAELDDEELVTQAEKGMLQRSNAGPSTFKHYLQKFMVKDEQNTGVSVGTAERLLDQLSRVRRRKERGGKDV
jgi:flagellar biogenesis protein FliO